MVINQPINKPVIDRIIVKIYDKKMCITYTWNMCFLASVSYVFLFNQNDLYQSSAFDLYMI